MDSRDQIIDNQEFYREIINFLRCAAAGEHWNSDKTWVRPQAVYFSLKDNQLYYGKQLKNKKVVINENDQLQILAEIHVDQTKGHHLGAKKMLRMLLKDYFWRNSQHTVEEYVKNCAVCTTNSTLSLEPLANNNPINPWRNVEFHWLEPENSGGNYSLAVIYDPASFWLSAAPILFNSFEISLFMFENFCNHGLASCSLYGIDRHTFEQIKHHFISFSEKTNSPFLSAEDFLIFKEEESVSFNNNMKGRITSFLEDPRWSERTTILSWLWKLRNENLNGTSALELICNQNISASNKPPAKRKSVSNTFRCQVCNDSFSSAVTLRSHYSIHASYDRVTDSSTSNQFDPVANNTAVHALSESPPVAENSLSSTVSAVKALIVEKRAKPPSKKLTVKRGEYHRYSLEQRTNIAEYALLHGNHEAARAFTTSLGFPVSYSSVRNFVQQHYAFPSNTKLEIGRYAAECGVENAQKFYSAKLNKTISESLVKRFRRIYYRTTPAVHHSNVPHFRKKCGPAAARHKFCASVRQEIGIYAVRNGTAAAVAHFSEKLQFPIKETTVRKFKKAVNNVSFNSENLQEEIGEEPQVPPPSPPPAPEPVAQQTQESNYYHQSQPYNHFPSSQYVYQSLNSYHHSNHQNAYGMTQQMQPTIHPCPSSYNSLPHPQQHYQPMQFQGYSRAGGSNWNEECQDISSGCNELLQMPQQNHFNQHHHNTMQQQRHGMFAGPSSSGIRDQQLLPVPAVVPPPLELNLPNNEVEAHVQRDVNISKPPKKINGRSSTKRGNYATYSPEFRLEVGKFAAAHGCHEACQHFKERIGHEIPDSTVRLLREKYLSRADDPNEKEITGLDTGPRGRPSLLGKHDAEVQECLRELKRSGEKINAFVAMTCARQVLLQKEPALLNTIKLSTSWAKTFLRRIGINKENSHAQTSNSVDNSN